MTRNKKTKQTQELMIPAPTDVAVMESLESELDRVRMELEATKREIEAKKQELKTIGQPSRQLDSQEVAIVQKQVTVSNEKLALQKKNDAQKEFDNQKVTGKFINRRAPGQSVKLTYLKYADDPVKWYPFEDGKVYTIQRGFADQINEYYHTPHFIQKQGEMNPDSPESAIHHVDTSNKKYAFVPVGF